MPHHGRYIKLLEEGQDLHYACFKFNGMSPCAPSLVWAVALILIATTCQVNSKVPPKFIRATRGASKAIYGTTRSGYPIFGGPRKVVVGSTSLKREIGSPPASFATSHGRRVRRRKTVKRAKKPSRRPSSYSYGVPVYAQKYKHYVPSRPVRYKTRAKPVTRLKLRLPTYTQVQDPDDYEEEDKPYIPDENYDYFDEPKPQVMSVTPIKTRPRPVITVVRKKKKKKRPKYSSKYKSTTPPSDEDEDTKVHDDEDEEEDEGYHRKPTSKPHRYQTEEHQSHRYQSHKYPPDSDGSYTQTPTYKDPSKFIPPYILTSNNYGGTSHNMDHAYQNHGYYTQMPPQYTPPSFTPPVYYPSTFNPHQYRPSDTDIGFGQGMEYVADKNPSSWK